MLRQDVIQAVADKTFHLYAVETVEQAIELLTGMKIGQINSEGQYPEGTFNAAVAKRIKLWEEVHKTEKESAPEDAD
jgi:predicted ATP-dependent protease